MVTSSLVIPDWSCLGWASPALIWDLIAVVSISV